MFFRVLIAVMLMGALSRASSIFDDDYKGAPDVPAAHSTKRPVPDPEPAGAPDAGPVITPPVNPTSRTNSNGQAPERPVIEPPAQSSDAPEAAPKNALEEALNQAQEALHRAEAAADESLRKDRGYVMAVERSKTEVAKGLSAASSSLQAQRIHDAFLAKDASYQNAKRYVRRLTRMRATFPKWNDVNPPVPTAEQFQNGIDDAIAQHGLAEGMTFQEACKSARRTVRLVSTVGAAKTYHWLIRGQTGTYTEVHRGMHGGARTETTPTYGVIGYVEGVFEDDYLVSFSRSR